MILCVCNNVNYPKALYIIRSNGIATVAEMKKHIDICDDCESCKVELENLIAEEGAANV